MIDEFYMNGLRWRVRFTYPTDPVLVDRTGNLPFNFFPAYLH